jgi:hypothetical protein
VSWIKVEKTTPDKPEMLELAGALGVSQGDAFLLLFRFWCWVDSHSHDGNVSVTHERYIDAVVGVTGFADALLAVGWLRRSGHVFEMPNFETHLSKSAKKRALGQARVDRHRNASSVTKALPEKIREDVRKKDPKKGPKKQAAQPKTAAPSPGFDPLEIEFPPSLDTERFRGLWADWVAVRRGKRYSLLEPCLKAQLRTLEPLGAENAYACLNHSVAGGHQGIYPENFSDKGRNGSAPPRNTGRVSSLNEPGKFDDPRYS